MSLLEMLQKRHSIRKYTDANISDQDLQTILQAGLLSASGRAARPGEFVWIEDCSIAMSNMHLAASTLGIGSCWIQGRLRMTPNDTTTEDYLRDLLGYPADYRLEATLSLGIPAEEKAQTELSALSADKIHYEKY